MSGSGMTDVKPPPASVGQRRVGVHEISEETLEQHLVPVAVKWTREWIREEAEDYLARECAYTLREVGNHVSHR